MDDAGESVSRFEDEEESPGFMLWRATVRWQRVMAATLAPLGLTHPQFVLLACAFWLKDRGGPPTQVRLAEQAGMDVKTASDVIARLEARGLFERRPDQRDSRAKLVHVTSAGADLVRMALPAVESADEGFFSPIDAPALAALLRPLGR